jgi:hypothetical protein
MRGFPWSCRPIGRVFVVLALLTVAGAPRSARAQVSAQGAAVDGPVVATVRHTLAGDVGAVLQGRWQPFTQQVGGLWTATGRVSSNVRALVVAESGAPLVGWQIRHADGALLPWDGQEVAVTVSLEPGEHEVSVQLVAPPTSAEPRHSVRLRVVSASRP